MASVLSGRIPPVQVDVGSIMGLEVSDNTFWPKDRKLVRMVLTSLGPILSDGDRVLEIGTGSGVLTRALAEGVGKRDVSFVATERNTGAFKDACRNLGGFGNVAVREGDMFSCVGDGELFDAIIWNPPWFGDASGRGRVDSARFDKDHADLMRFVSGGLRRLKPGGSLFIVLPREESQVLWDSSDKMSYSIAEEDRYQTAKRVVALYRITNS